MDLSVLLDVWESALRSGSVSSSDSTCISSLESVSESSSVGVLCLNDSLVLGLQGEDEARVLSCVVYVPNVN